MDSIITILFSSQLHISLVILGVICIIVAIIGKIPPMDITGGRAVGLATFGAVLIVAAILSAWVLVPTTAGPEPTSVISPAPTPIQLTATATETSIETTGTPFLVSSGNTTTPDNNVKNNDEADSELPLVVVTYPQLFFFETDMPDGTSIKIQVREGEVQAMTSGTICVASVCLPGGMDRGSVVIFLPGATYDVTGLNPKYNWHGSYYADPSQWKIIADQLASEQKIPGTCSDGDGCSVVDVVVVDPEGIVEQYQE